MDKYQTISSRFFALFIDGIVLIPISFLIPFLTILSGINYSAIFVAEFFTSLLGVSYYIFLHAKYGQTLGKKICRVRVINSSEIDLNVDLINQPSITKTPSEKASYSRITYQQSILRSSPQLVQIMGLVLGQASLNSDESVASKFYLEYGNGIIIGLIIVWTIADIIVALSNDKHRALHDYIAGTVVIKT